MGDRGSTLSVDQLRTHVECLPRFPLAHLPTPLEPLPRFSQALGGPTIHIKRDDCTGLAFGGNKARHNEFLMGQALEQGADMFVWGAGVQSNNCRQTAAACAKAGLDCHLVLGRGKPADGPDPVQGNLLLDHLIGASYEIVDEPVGTDLDKRIDQAAQRFRAQGRNVYTWNRETLKPLAAVSYVLCMIEILEECGRAPPEGWSAPRADRQLAERVDHTEQPAAQGFIPDAVYVSSAGSTGSGLALGAAALEHSFPVRNICPIRWEWDTQADMTRIANEAAALIGIGTRLQRDDLHVSFDYIGPGYGQVSPEGLEAIALLARTEGILVDPIYSGKALAGLIDDVRSGRLSDTQHVVFVHTGGTPALFAYHDALTAGIAPRSL